MELRSRFGTAATAEIFRGHRGVLYVAAVWTDAWDTFAVLPASEVEVLR